MWSKKKLEQEMTWEEFEKEMQHFRAWVSKDRPHTFRYWLFILQSWANGDH